jgi:hypothetical protein
MVFELEQSGVCRLYVTWQNFPATGTKDVKIYSGDGTYIGGGGIIGDPAGSVYTNNVFPNDGTETVYVEMSDPTTYSDREIPTC